MVHNKPTHFQTQHAGQDIILKTNSQKKKQEMSEIGGKKQKDF